MDPFFPSPFGRGQGEGGAESTLRTLFTALPGQVFELVNTYQIHTALAQIMEALAGLNGYLERSAPWRVAKTGDLAQVDAILSTAAEGLRIAAILLSPVLPEKSAEICRRLGWQGAPADGLNWGCLAPGTRVETGEALFPRE